MSATSTNMYQTHIPRHRLFTTTGSPWLLSLSLISSSLLVSHASASSLCPHAALLKALTTPLRPRCHSEGPPPSLGGVDGSLEPGGDKEAIPAERCRWLSAFKLNELIGRQILSEGGRSAPLGRQRIVLVPGSPKSCRSKQSCWICYRKSPCVAPRARHHLRPCRRL